MVRYSLVPNCFFFVCGSGHQTGVLQSNENSTVLDFCPILYLFPDTYGGLGCRVC